MAAATPSARANDLRAWLDGFVRAPWFLAKYPYYAAVLARLAPVADPSVHSMAVALEPTGRFYLHVNVEYFVKNPQYLPGILLHEVHHVVLGHLSDPKFHEPADRELMELALEMSANEYIEEPLPDPIVWRAFERFGVRAGQSTLERYERLVASRKGGTGEALRAAIEKARAGSPRPGGNRGESKEQVPAVDDHGPWLRVPRDSKRGESGAVPPAGGSKPQGPHSGAPEHARKLLSDAMAATQREHGDALAPPSGPMGPMRLAGREPGALLEQLAGALREPEVALDWKAALAMFVARSRAPVHTYSRPSRRFPERVGAVPGRTWAPRRVTRPHVLVAIDTSLSMTDTELSEIARQLRRVSEHARVTVAECDVEIARVYPFAGVLRDVAGRGGTDLRPVFAPEFLRAHRPDGVVYFTDGEGPFPAAQPPVATLWVITKPIPFACAWGERAVMYAGSAQADAAGRKPTAGSTGRRGKRRGT